VTSLLRDALARLVDAHRRGAHLALLFDYDGTLVPIAEHPRMAFLADETRNLLERLGRIPSVSVGVLSGRSIDNLRQAVGIKGLLYVGTNGLELFFGETTIRHPDSGRGARLAIAATEHIRPVLTSYAGAWIEQKPLGLAVHYRSVKERDRIDKLRTDVARAIEPFSEELRVLDASMAIDIMPDLGWTKGSALRMIVAYVGGNALVPLYAGDEANDADALTIAAQLGGVAIGVGPLAPATAQHLLPDPLALRCCLEALLKMLIATSVPAYSL
jgi:trehalose 6-phosphate phosphatase